MTGSAAVLEALRGFGVEGDTLGLAREPGGHINQSWRVHAGARLYLLQRLNPAVFPNGGRVMANLVAVTDYLGRAVRQAGLPEPERRVLTVVRSRSGRPWVDGPDGAIWRLFDFIPGTRVASRVSNSEEAREIGRAYGTFQRLLASYDGPPLAVPLPGFHDTMARLARLESVAGEAPVVRLEPARALLDGIRERAFLAELLPRLIEGGLVPERIVHNDAKCTNVLLDARTGEAMAVIDLDTVMPGTLLYDFGDLVRSVSCPTPEDTRELDAVGMDLNLYRGLATGFLEEVADRLTAAERSHLVAAGEIITYEQGIRFLTDHLEGDRYYRIERPGQNLDRAAVQLRLLDSLEHARESLLELVAGLHGGR